MQVRFFSPVTPSEQWTKPDIVDLENVARPDGVVLQKRAPALTVSRWTDSADVALDGAFGDAESELKEFPTDSLCSPGAVVEGHARHELDGLRWDA